MTIHNPAQFVASMWDWGCLRGCFGETHIEPTDIDGFVERRGKFLVMETKLPGASIPQGQELTFAQLRNTGRFTVFVVWGKPGKPEKIRVITRKMDQTFAPADIDMLRRFVRKWFDFADGYST